MSFGPLFTVSLGKFGCGLPYVVARAKSFLGLPLIEMIGVVNSSGDSFLMTINSVPAIPIFGQPIRRSSKMENTMQ